MAGMEALGRIIDVVGVASGHGISLKNASGITFIALASDTSQALAVTAAKTYGGNYDDWTTGNGFGQPDHFYQNADDDGTGAWTKETAVWTSNSVALAGTANYVAVLEIFADQLADGYEYIKVTETDCTYVVAILHDLTVQRTPANLAILGA
jgi:hypothetical protein